MKKRIISFEEISLNTETNVAVPGSFDMLDEKGTLATMSGFDTVGSTLTSNIGTGQDTVASLEAMSRYLEKNGSKHLGKAGVMFANIAIEQLCSNARVALEDLPMDAKAYEINPEKEIAAGVDSIKTASDALASGMNGDLIKLLYNLTQKREAFNRLIGFAYHRIDEVQEAIDLCKKASIPVKPSVTVFENSEQYNGFFYGHRGLVAKGATVVHDVTNLLTEHEHLYKRLVHTQLHWIEQHKENILATPEGFDQYSFNPTEYSTSGATAIPAGEGKVIYVGKVLPGSVTFNCETASETLFGYEGAQALIDSKSTLNTAKAPVDDGRPTLDKAPITVLSIKDIEARLAEIRQGLKCLSKWCDASYSKLWKDAFFEETIISFLLKKDADSLSDRGLSLLSVAVLSLLEGGTADIGAYALETFSSLLCYVEDSIASYARSGEGERRE